MRVRVVDQHGESHTYEGVQVACNATTLLIADPQSGIHGFPLAATHFHLEAETEADLPALERMMG